MTAMRWPRFFIVLLLVYLAQTALLPHLAPPWLDLLLVMALVYGLAAAAPDARLAGWLVGFAKDLDTDAPLGLHALMLGLCVLALTFLREMVNLQLWWVRWIVAFLVAFPAELLVRGYLWFGGGAENLSLMQILAWSLTTALVASFLATLVLALPAALRRRRRRAAARRW